MSRSTTLFCSASISNRPQRAYAGGISLRAFQPPFANWLKSAHALAERSRFARSNPGSEPDESAPLKAFDPPDAFCPYTRPPATHATTAINANTHNTAAHRTFGDFMTVGSSKNSQTVQGTFRYARMIAARADFGKY